MRPGERRPLSTRGVRALETLAEVMRTGSATAAAANLGMTQPGVSRTLAQIERAIGFELFYRDRGKLVPTKDGLLLTEDVEFALAGLQRVSNLASDIASSAAGELSVVAPPSFADGVLPGIVASFLRNHPGVRFNLDSRSLETSKASIATHVVDCGFMKMPVAGDDLRCEPLVSSGSGCVLRADHPSPDTKSSHRTCCGARHSSYLALAGNGASRSIRLSPPPTFARQSRSKPIRTAPPAP
jgi:DNA-binding transcriptional LysR family regulator